MVLRVAMMGAILLFRGAAADCEEENEEDCNSVCPEGGEQCTGHADCGPDTDGTPRYCDGEGDNSCLRCFPEASRGGRGLVDYSVFAVEFANEEWNSECVDPTNGYSSNCRLCEYGLCSYFGGPIGGSCRHSWLGACFR